jgi:hypothetical protein
LLLLVLCSAGCTGVRRTPDGGGGTAAPVVVYRAAIERGEDRQRFRLWLYLAGSEGLHAEVVSPVGRTELIVDGNPSRLSVAFVRERLAFSGPPTADALERVVGVAVAFPDLLEALLEGHRPEGCSVEREGPRGSAPGRFALRCGETGLTLERKRSGALRGDPSRLASGLPPAGFDERELEALETVWFDEDEP